MVLERHPKKYKHFIRIMLTHLVETENITTTRAKAKHLKPYAQKLLRFAKKAETGKKSPLNLLRGRIHTKKAEKKLLVDLVPRIKHIRGGLINLKETGERRRGDNAPMVQISIKGNEKSEFQKKKAEQAMKKSTIPSIKQFSARILLEQKQFMQNKMKQKPELEQFLKKKIGEIGYRQWQLEKNPKQPPKYTLLI